jgi:hypothetical protein
MTRGDINRLEKLARQRARVAKKDIETREARLRADVEAQLSAYYTIDNSAWADVTRATQEAVADADRFVAERCRELGIPENFRPKPHFIWSGRGENADTSRRVELRKLAYANITAAGMRAKLAIEHLELEVLTDLCRAGLTTDVAREFLEKIPTPEQLMPPIVVAELEEMAPRKSDRQVEMSAILERRTEQ